MPIKAHCGSCGATFQAKDSLAGKKVKCPKCSAPIIVGSSKVAGTVGNEKKAAVGAAGVRNPLLDLLDEADVKSAARGPLCPNCSTEMKRGAILCVNCGFNTETGEKIRRVVQVDESDELSGMSETEKLMVRAEQDIEDMPITGVGQDFGDGGSAALVALVAGGILLVLVAIGMVIILSMEQLTKTVISPGAVSFLASAFLYVAMSLWIIFVAFKQKPTQGIVCVATGGLWCIVFGFSQGRGLITPTVILLFSFVIGVGAGYYVYLNGFGPAPVSR
jgi:DNA-directed RNA polymerase subunit RPC12/RpoP